MKALITQLLFIKKRRITLGIPMAACLSLCGVTKEAKASVVYYPATDEIKFVSDGRTGVYVEYGVGDTFFLWADATAANLSEGADNSGQSNTWSLWSGSWGPKTGAIVKRIQAWRELPPSQQRKSIDVREVKKWDKASFVTAKSPRRYPAQTDAQVEVAPVPAEPIRDSNGCLPGERWYTQKQGGFLGIGEKTVVLGCMTPAQAHGLHTQQQMQHQTEQQMNNIRNQQMMQRLNQEQQMQQQQFQLQQQQRQIDSLRYGY